jgi:MFS family permease
VSDRTHARWQLAALCGVQFVDVLGVTSAVTAIPAMLRGVAAPAEATPMLAAVYAMFFGGLLVLGARLGDRYGHRRVLMLGVAAFIGAGLVGATASDVIQLLTARAMQGAAAAVSVPCALRLLLAAPAPPRGALALWSASGAAAGALGYLVGGLLTDISGWRAVFWINIPAGLLLFVAIGFLVPPGRGDRRSTRLDLVGAIVLIGAVMALIVGASLVEEPARRVPGWILLAAGIGLGAGFAVQQRRAGNPLVPRPAWRSANLRTGTLVSFVNTATTSSAGVLATLLLQQQFGVSAVRAGLLLLPFSLGVIGGTALYPPLTRRLTTRRLAAIGLLGIAAGNLLLAVTYGSVAGIVAGVIVAGTGLGIASVAGNAIGTDVDESLRGTASGVLNTGAQLGTALGVAGLLVLAVTIDRPWPGTALAWAVAAIIAGLAALALVAGDVGGRTGSRSLTGRTPGRASPTAAAQRPTARADLGGVVGTKQAESRQRATTTPRSAGV